MAGPIPAGSGRIFISYTFVGARNAAGEHRDSLEMNQGRTLAPGETIDAQGRVLLDSAGVWQLWPCYEFTGGGCPDVWQAFPVTVR